MELKKGESLDLRHLMMKTCHIKIHMALQMPSLNTSNDIVKVICDWGLKNTLILELNILIEYILIFLFKIIDNFKHNCLH